jgi:hypothetical protein
MGGNEQGGWSMTIAFDIDGTWDRDPSMWLDCADKMTDAGHTIIFVTGRTQPPDKLQRLGITRDFFYKAAGRKDFPVIVSGPLFKEEAALKAGYKVSVWIDDAPGMIQRTAILEAPKDDSKL